MTLSCQFLTNLAAPGLSAFAARRKFQDVGVVPDQTHDSISATVLGLEHEPLDVTDPLHEPQRDLTFVIPNAVGQRAASFSSCSSKDSLGDCACSPASLDVIEADKYALQRSRLCVIQIKQPSVYTNDI